MKLKTREIAIFAMLGAIMFVSKVVMEGIPNVHLLGTFVVAFTLTYRVKALFPIYGYVFVNGLWEGFSPFGWLPEVYLWLILWGATMLLPQNMPRFWICFSIRLSHFEQSARIQQKSVPEHNAR